MKYKKPMDVCQESIKLNQKNKEFLEVCYIRKFKKLSKVLG
ncbi:hypothetical protein [uncultured Gammaproteobacteria bacterium]|nr:hypothetical protein [uncultured Gammaproteobacteria bacterium]CAC9964972.1 hypothetical protein [uncultured Gammaproteobacteria bacterium]CAC9980965.1 hypothetical protein [uncultured Gammaproteobacteria bacterium]